ncbi:TetR family transcriptional regulator [Stackebrandtia albiflava]|uniref:TetR family transcriptional regulator n=1 Tax=Stackebrandtia albiflava TaxID=406432 RepID=A0A562VAN1_9ACTN|nr:TetR/AcrR family transcriptional regulator [Stackebrandtia albiflava]TWJ14867.1 TetR family transcriptional regulator [Stackebrandtia albiflava]
MESVTSPPSRRDQQRADTIAQIKAVARDQLTTAGPAAISLRAIARTMGMSAPALYRYFPGLDALVTALCADLYDELRRFMVARCDTLPETDMIGRLLTAARGFRLWAVRHRPEFTLMFASLVPGAVIAGPGCHSRDLDPEQEPYASMRRFSQVFGDMFHKVFHQSDAERGFTLRTPQPPPMTPGLREEIQRCATAIGADVPIEFGYAFHSFWIRLYGLVAMEVFGQLPVVQEAEALLDAELHDMAGQLGLNLTEFTASRAD